MEGDTNGALLLSFGHQHDLGVGAVHRRVATCGSVGMSERGHFGRRVFLAPSARRQRVDKAFDFAPVFMPNDEALIAASIKPAHLWRR